MHPHTVYINIKSTTQCDYKDERNSNKWNDRSITEDRLKELSLPHAGFILRLRSYSGSRQSRLLKERVNEKEEEHLVKRGAHLHWEKSNTKQVWKYKESI